MEEKWSKAIKSHYDFIIERMSPEFGLTDRLFAHRTLTNTEKNMIEKKKIIQKKNKMILDCLSKNHRLKTLVELLGKCDQKHLMKYLENDGNYSDEFDGDWPLTDEAISTIDNNYADLVDLLEVSELIGHLFSTGVINRRQRDYISSKSTPYEQNGALVEILRRSSLRSYWQTITCLHQTNQSHIAEILAAGGAIMRVDVHLKARERNVNEIEKEIATKINNLLSDKSSDEVERIFDQLKLIRAETCHSVSLYFLCNQLEEVERLEKLTKDGRLKEIIESLFNRLMKTPVKIQIKKKWKSYFFTKRPKVFLVKDLPLTTINHLPLEALDIILQKSYLVFIERENRDQNQEDETIVKQLASVDLCWSKRMTNLRFKRTLWTRLPRFFKVKCRASYLYKCNKQFAEENVIKLPSNKRMLKVSGILSDIEYAVNTRTKTSAYKKKSSTNGTEGFPVFTTFRNETIHRDCIKYLEQAEGGSVVKVFEKEGASVRVDIRGGRDMNTDEFVNRLHEITDQRMIDSTEVKTLINELNVDEMEILNSVQDRDVVVWIWCKSRNALEKLKQINKSNTITRLSSLFTKENVQCINIDGDQLKKDIERKTTKQKYLMQIADQKTAREWHRLIENGVPQDKALEWLKNEATSATAPIEYHDAWIVHNDQDIRVNNDITTAECLALRIYSNAVHEFYSKFNEDCSNCKWEHYTVFTSLLQSALCKRRRKYSVNTLEVIPDDECETDVKRNENTFMSEEIETLTPPFRIFPAKRICFPINTKSSPILASQLIKGSLLGAVVGNYVGAQCKNLTVTTSIETLKTLETGAYKRSKIVSLGDTYMALALANSLTRTQTVDVEDLIECFLQAVSADSYQKFSVSIIYFHNEFKNQKKDDDPFAPAKRLFDGQGSKGVGGAVRIAPLAVRYFYEEENKLNEYVRTVTALTHSHPIGINGAILQAAAVQLALVSSLNGRHSDDFGQDYVDELFRRMKPIESVNGIFLSKLRKIKKYLRTSPTEETIRNHLGTGITVDESVPTAIYCFLRGMKPIPGIPSDRSEFERIIIYAISLGGKADSIASMAGAIAGAYYGQDAVTQRWRDLCETKAIDDAKLYANKIQNLVWK